MLTLPTHNAAGLPTGVTEEQHLDHMEQVLKEKKKTSGNTVTVKKEEPKKEEPWHKL